MEAKEIKPIVDKIPEDMNIELNVSCPNTDKHVINKGLKVFLNNKRNWCIIKLPPNNCENLDIYYKEGFRQFHISNTLPTTKGGLSGPTLRPFTEKGIRYIMKNIKICYYCWWRDTVDDIKFIKIVEQTILVYLLYVSTLFYF